MLRAWYRFYSLIFNTLPYPKFAISQSGANSTVLISYDIKSLTWYPSISWSLSSKVMLPYDKLQRGFANKQTTRNLRFSWCLRSKKGQKLSRQNLPGRRLPTASTNTDSDWNNGIGITKFFAQFGFWKFRKWNSKQTS